MSWTHRMCGATICGVVCALCLFGGVAHASPANQASRQCTGSCIWYDKGESGWGSNGTGVSVTLPGYVSSLGGQDGVEAAAWITDNGTKAIETGAVYGYTEDAGSYLSCFYPIATQNDGDNEHASPSYEASPGGTYILRSFHNAVNNKLGFSFFNDQYDTPQWAVSWGTYDTGNAENLTVNEIHGFSGDQPIWSDKFHFANAQWRDGNDNWNLWGFLNVNQDCPYHGVYLSSTSWDAYSYGC